MSNLTGAAWRKSTHSSSGGEGCVEVADNPLAGVVGVRDSKDPAGAVLSYPPQTWADFVAAVKRGEFAQP